MRSYVGAPLSAADLCCSCNQSILWPENTTLFSFQISRHAGMTIDVVVQEPAQAHRPHPD